MINKDNITTVAVISGAGADKVSPEGIVAAITSEQLNNLPILGLTFGAWVTLFLGLGAIVVTLHGLLKFYRTAMSRPSKFIPDEDEQEDKV